LGLAIVKKIIEEHKGWIKIENLSDLHSDLADCPNSGAVVTISLPLDA
jgi:nitrogen fixation/metabolism regulation signal transduction histidine kinase